jgi:hypothetical protein
MSNLVLRCPQGLDARGVPEEFTRDLEEIAKIDDVSHLSPHGLVKVGTIVHPGMILVGKLGAKRADREVRKLNVLEQQLWTLEQKRAYWENWAYDGSLYAPADCFGQVSAAYFEVDGVRQEFDFFDRASGVAVVEICVMDPNSASIIDEILSKRECGYRTCVVEDRQFAPPVADSDLFQLADAFVAEPDFTGLGAHWTKIGREDARSIIEELLYKDMAYGVSIMPRATAKNLAERFISLFGEGARYLTNGNFILPTTDPRSVPNSGDPISTSTFDSGVVCVDTNRLGILWVEDED